MGLEIAILLRTLRSGEGVHTMPLYSHGDVMMPPPYRATRFEAGVASPAAIRAYDESTRSGILLPCDRGQGSTQLGTSPTFWRMGFDLGADLVPTVFCPEKRHLFNIAP